MPPVGRKPRRGILGVDAGFDGMPGHRDVVLRDRQLLARGDAHLQFDEVDAGDHFGDRMLDLQTGVHLHEEELVGPVGGHDELDGARAGVVDAARGIAGRSADPRPRRRVQQRRRRLLDHLLVASLQAAFAFAEMDDVAVAVGEHLDLDVAGVQHESLEEQGVVAECRAGLAPRTDQRGRQVRRFVHDPHALAAAAGRRLHQHRIADVACRCDQVFVGEAGPGDARHDGHAERRYGRLGGDLVTHGLDRLDRRSDEHDARRLQRSGEFGVLREEPVTRMDRLGAGAAGGVDDRVDVEVALPRAAAGPMRTATSASATWRASASASLNTATERIPICAQRADHPHGDLAAVGRLEQTVS